MTAAQPVFSVVPIEVVQDRRLTLWHVRVLVALLSFRRKKSEMVWPSREQIAERAAMHVANVSRTTTELVALGWLTKVGEGGRGKSCEYRITVPETAAEPATVSTGETEAKPATDSYAQTVAADTTVADSATVADSVTQTLADSATRIRREESKEQSSKEKAACARPDEVDETAWRDWLTVRRAKKSPLTASALAGVQREAAKANLSLGDAIRICAERSWVGFKAEWDWQRSAPQTGPPPRAAPTRASVFMASLNGSSTHPTQRETIDVHASQVDPASPSGPVGTALVRAIR